MQDENKAVVQDQAVALVEKELGVSEQKAQGPSDEEVLKHFTKQINVLPCADEILKVFLKAIESLESLKIDVESKKTAIFDHQKDIGERLVRFQQSGLVNVDDLEHQKSNESINQFAKILDAMITEITTDITFYRSLVSSGHPEYVTVLRSASDSFDAYVLQCIQNIKRYIKMVNRDLSVSYSRYNYGFDVQMKRIAYIEHVIKRATESKASSAS